MTQHAAHSILCQTTAPVVFGLIQDATGWPNFVEPCDAVTELESGSDYQLVEISARLQGRLMSWQSRRRILADVFGIEADMVKPMPLLESMHTSWRVFACDDTSCVLRLEHAYDVRSEVEGLVDGVSTRAEAEAFIAEAIARNTRVELASFKEAAESGAGDESRNCHIRHTVVCDGAPDAVYGLIRDVSRWPELFAACVGVSVEQSGESSELVRVDAMQAGQTVSWVTRRSYRDAIHRIDYELVVPMPFVAAMSGEWRVVPIDAHRCLLTVDRRWQMANDVTGIRSDVRTPAQAAAFVRGFIDSSATAEMQAISELVADAEPGLAASR